jgi:hypothetical protein
MQTLGLIVQGIFPLFCGVQALRVWLDFLIGQATINTHS